MWPIPDNYILQIITKMKHLRWWNVFDDTKCVRCWSFCLVWRKSIHFWQRYARKKQFLHFRSLLTFRPQICSPSYSCPRCFHEIVNFCGFFTLRKSEARDRRTDGRSATLNAAPREGCIISVPEAFSVLVVACGWVGMPKTRADFATF